MSTSNDLTPAELVINSFNGVRATARALRCHPSTVSRWQKLGHIPNPYQRRILDIAWQNGIDLTAHDMIFGRSA